MNAKTLLAVVLGAIANFFLGFLIYGLLLMDFMQANTTVYDGLMKDESQAMNGYVLSSIIFAVLLTYIFRKAHTATAGSGLVTAAVVSFLMAIGMDTMFYFGMNLHTGMAMLVDVIAYTVMGSLTGLVIGWALNRGRATAASGATVA